MDEISIMIDVALQIKNIFKQLLLIQVHFSNRIVLFSLEQMRYSTHDQAFH